MFVKFMQWNSRREFVIRVLRGCSLIKVGVLNKQRIKKMEKFAGTIAAVTGKWEQLCNITYVLSRRTCNQYWLISDIIKARRLESDTV